MTPFALRVGPQACLQAVCTKALAHSHSVLAYRWAYSHKALADTGPCLQARDVLFASRYTYEHTTLSWGTCRCLEGVEGLDGRYDILFLPLGPSEGAAAV
jgi:hypothetical protein